MNGLGYVPVCSSSSMSKTCKDYVYGITAPFFRYCDCILPIS